MSRFKAIPFFIFSKVNSARYSAAVLSLMFSVSTIHAHQTCHHTFLNVSPSAEGEYTSDHVGHQRVSHWQSQQLLQFTLYRPSSKSYYYSSESLERIDQ